MKIPNQLKHKPVFVVEDYHDIDGPYAGPSSDAKGLSLGLAQWNDRGNVDISAKVWRHTGEKWSRQSEELPFHRVLDLALLICEAQKYVVEAGTGQISLQGSEIPVAINVADNPMIEQDLRLFRNTLSRDREWLDPRLQRLTDALWNLGYRHSAE